MADQRVPLDLEAILKDCDPVIRSRVKNKLHVSLSESDGSKRNQDALEVYRDATVKLVEKLTRLQDGSDGQHVRDFRGYAATLANHTLANYLNEINPDRRILKDKLRYFLEERSGYSVWDDDGKKQCGFKRWQFQTATVDRTDRLLEVRDNPALIDRAVIPHKHLDKTGPGDWADLVNAIFNFAEGPVALDDLIETVTRLLGIKDQAQQSDNKRAGEEDEVVAPEPPDSSPDPLDQLMQKEYLGRLWAEVCLLKPLMRIAYFLNLGGSGKKAARLSMVEIGQFPARGIVTSKEIGRALGLSDRQFDGLWDELPLDDASRRSAKALATYDEKFALLWNHLPLEDKTIAIILACDPKTVTTARFRAINDHLKPRMRALGFPV